MQAVHTQGPLAFSYVPTAPPTTPPTRTLNDFRMGQNNYTNASSFSDKAMRPLLIVALLIAVGVGIAWTMSKSSENGAAKIGAAPTASSLPVTPNDSVVATPLIPLPKLEEVTPAPSAAPANTRSSESVKPVKMKSLVEMKAARVAAKEVAAMPAVPVNETTPPPQASPPAPPTAVVIEEKPVAPPVAPPVEASQ
jgi:hypothetical protein